MLTRMMLIIIMQLVRGVSFALAALDHHLLRERVVLVNRILVIGVDGVGDRVAAVLVGAQGAFARHKVETGPVDSFGPFDPKVLVEHEDFVELGLGWASVVLSWPAPSKDWDEWV